MSGRSIAQEYYILAVNENGYMPGMHMEESNSGLVAAGMMELLLNDIIIMEKKKITVVGELPADLDYLASLYAYLCEKVRSTDKMMSDYIASTGKRIQQLTQEIGEALLKKGAVTKEKGGFFGSKVIYIPEKGYKETVIRALKSAVVEEGDLSAHDIALLSILKGSKNLNRYISDDERSAFKARLKELKKNPDSKQLAEMIDYINDSTGLLLAAFVIWHQVLH